LAFRPIDAWRDDPYHRIVNQSGDGDGPDGPTEAGETPAPGEAPAAAPVGEPASFDAEVPQTRRQSAAAIAHPPQFPDDGALSGWLRRADRALGTGEQALLFGLLSLVVLTAATAALSDRVLHVDLGRWWFDVVRGGTFSIAMIGAVFASHQQRHLSMDLVSRRLPPRGRLVLRVILAVFTVAIASLLVRSGLHQLATVGGEGANQFISTHTIVTFMPIGGVLIIAHTILHMVIDIDYLARGKTPPERMRSAH
jgi:TRAP-type C4-dicarboxylate transport system permease small subunit